MLLEIKHKKAPFAAAAGEVQKMLEEQNVSLSDVEPAALDTMQVLSRLEVLLSILAEFKPTRCVFHAGSAVCVGMSS